MSGALDALEAQVTTCRACPRLVAWREQIARDLLVGLEVEARVEDHDVAPRPRRLQRPRHALDERLGVDEDHGAGAFAAREQAKQQRQLLFIRGVIELLADARRTGRIK